MARKHGIEAVTIPDKWRAGVEEDPQAKRIRELERQLHRAASALPKLRLVFGTGGLDNRLRVSLKAPAPLREDEIEREVEERRSTLLALSSDASASPRDGIATDKYAALAALGMYSRDEVQRYDEDVQRFLTEYEDYLRENWDYLQHRASLLELRCDLLNDGSAPADDVDVRIHFPDGFALYEEEELPEKPTEPSPVEPPRTMMQMFAAGIAMPRIQPIFPTSVDYLTGLKRIQVPANVSLPTIKRSNSYDVDVHVRRVKHGDRVNVVRLFLEFDSYDTAYSFHIDYELRPVNLPDPVLDQLHVIVSRK